MKQNINNSGWVVLAGLGMIGLISTANFASASVNSETQKAASRAGAASVAEVSFSKESTQLSDRAKKELQEVITEASKKGQIKEIRVAAWSDQDYPAKGIHLAGSQIDLAAKRAENVQSYLKESLKVTDVSTMNMAERPNDIQNIFKTSEAKTKNNFENTGAAPSNSDQTGFLGLKGKASEVVVMIYYKK